jgi:DNA polymerase III subunit beta
MKITIEQGIFVKALAHIQSVVDKRGSIPILKNILIAAETDGLVLTATDLDIEISESVAASVAETGRLTVPGQILYDMARKLPAGAQVAMSSADNKLTVTAGPARFSLSTLPPEDFPRMAAGNLPCRFFLPIGDAKRLIDKTGYAISPDEAKFYLNGIFLHFCEDKNALRGVATDGHRLALCDLSAPDGAGDMPGLILPRKTVTELRRLLEDATGDIDVAASEAKIRFGIDNTVLISKTIDGTFPDYRRVIPERGDHVLTADVKALSDAVGRVTVLASDKSSAVKLACEQGRLTLSVENPNAGNASEEIAATYSAPPLGIGFNARYLQDVTGVIEGASMRLSASDAMSPALIEDAADAGTLHVLMPLRVNW